MVRKFRPFVRSPSKASGVAAFGWERVVGGGGVGLRRGGIAGGSEFGVWDLGVVCSICAMKMFCCAMKTSMADSSERSRSSVLRNGFDASAGVSGTNKEGSSGSGSDFLVFPAMLEKSVCVGVTL